ncbi:arylsulfatase [Alienimonas chondri]|uniref:Sulfatase N-terminal domain-containing protein n=1 Tax=Alienimonas chondri TaxID=2681879 RepID=A0ABX1VFG5_9PLAN|nr:arylsulfatase [Alienimonas chondri]NNJ26255.1 hypothetical protein [Alienimonas chondri]
MIRSRPATLLAWALLAVLPTVVGPVGAAGDRPNVIVVMTDDQGYGDFSFNGNPVAATPHIDRLAAESVRLTDFHVAPMCTPTRGQLMTGLDAFRNGAVNVSSGRALMRTDVKTMANVFADAGYRTGLFGKWHLGDNIPFRPGDRGFEEALWFPSSHIGSVPDAWNNDYFRDEYVRNGAKTRYDGYCTDVFFREATDWMNRDDDRPFFAYIAPNAAHWPWFVPEQYRGPVRAALDANPDVAADLTDQQREDLISFLAMGANIDENVGALTAFLDRAGLAENTVVVFLTDNGSTMGELYYNAGMRGKKTQLWEGGHRVPCLIRAPGGAVEPRDVDALTHVQDLLPTLAELAGVPCPDGLDGVSLAPLLRGEAETLGDRTLVVNYSRMPNARRRARRLPDLTIPRKEGAGVLWGPWRLLQGGALYHVDRDPHQDRDVSADHPQVVARLQSHLDRWWEGVREDAVVVRRVVVGDDAENPSDLTACEWLNVFVDQQAQVRRGDRKNGTWSLSVARPGRYELTLRRWPKESGLQLDAPAPAYDAVDGTFPAGVALPIAAATVTAAGRTVPAPVSADGTACTVQLDLPAGPLDLQTTFLDADGEEICGAYYLTVERLSAVAD